MYCLEFRQIKLSDPYTPDPAMDQHRDGCDFCSQFEQEISTLDANIHKALSVEVSEGLAARILLNQSLQKVSRMPTRRLWLSMAASFFLVTFMVYQFLLPGRAVAIEEQLLAHINHQPHDFYGEEHTPIENDQLQRVLKAINAEGEIDNVVYAAVCPLDGEQAAHLVIKNGEDQYTVMLIPEYSPGNVFEVNNDIWRGYISPHPAGAIAVLADASHSNAVSKLRTISERYHGSFNLTAGI
ncbi:MAG: DUF3379 family protein [bacterium]